MYAIYVRLTKYVYVILFLLYVNILRHLATIYVKYTYVDHSTWELLYVKCDFVYVQYCDVYVVKHTST